MLKEIPMPEIVIEEVEVFEEIFENPFTVSKDNDVFVVEGPYVKKLINSINFEDYESLGYFQTSLRKSGIVKALEKAGVKEGDTVRMLELEFEFMY